MPAMSDRSETRLSMPMALVAGSVMLALLAGLFLAASDGVGLALLLAGAAGFAASTMWLVGCVAMGVRIGLERE